MIRMTEEQRAEFLRSTSLDIALMRTRFDEIDEQKIYEKGQRDVYKRQVQNGRVIVFRF